MSNELNDAVMLNGISWDEYALVVTLSLIAYYAAISLWFYLQRFKVPNLEEWTCK